MAEHNIIGTIGEDTATEVMSSKGYRILDRNWKMGHLEMDIIAENKHEIVFVEVKTRTSLYNGKRPEEYVDQTKRRRMIAAANAYIKMNAVKKEPRFDIIGILIDPATNSIQQLTHLQDAFQPYCRTIGQTSYNGQWRWSHRNKVIK